MKKMVGVLRHLPSLAYVFEKCRKKSRAKLLFVIGGRLYKVWECMGTHGGHRGSFICSLGSV